MPATTEAWLLYGLMLLFLSLLIVVLVQLIFYLRRANRGGYDRRTARHVLDERYARGEIDRDEYERMRRDLQGS